MIDEIPLYPPIPDRLRLAAKQGTLIPFIGAGVSQLGGCPGWDLGPKKVHPAPAGPGARGAQALLWC